jgi:hypothetical protein
LLTASGNIPTGDFVPEEPLLPLLLQELSAICMTDAPMTNKIPAPRAADFILLVLF